MTAKERIVSLLKDGIYRTASSVARELSLPTDATRRNLNQLRTAGAVKCNEAAGGNLYVSVAV